MESKGGRIYRQSLSFESSLWAIEDCLNQQRRVLDVQNPYSLETNADFVECWPGTRALLFLRKPWEWAFKHRDHDCKNLGVFAVFSISFLNYFFSAFYEISSSDTLISFSVKYLNK